MNDTETIIISTAKISHRDTNLLEYFESICSDID